MTKDVNNSGFKKGDLVGFSGNESKFKIISKPKYIATSSSGLYYADIQWLDTKTKQKNYMISRRDLVKVSKSKMRDVS